MNVGTSNTFKYYYELYDFVGEMSHMYHVSVLQSFSKPSAAISVTLLCRPRPSLSDYRVGDECGRSSVPSVLRMRVMSPSDRFNAEITKLSFICISKLSLKCSSTRKQAIIGTYWR